MKSLGFVGKLMFAIVIALSGVNHFTNNDQIARMIPDYMPLPEIFAYATGIALLAAAVALLINKKAQVAMILLGVMLILFAVLVHLPGGDASMGYMFRDLALAGAAWFMGSHAKD